MTVITCPNCGAEEEVEIVETYYPDDFGVELPKEFHVHAARCKKCGSIIYCSSNSRESYEEVAESLEEVRIKAEDYFKYTKEWYDTL